MVTPWRTIKGAEPDAIKVASPVLNAGNEETGLLGNAPCSYATGMCLFLSNRHVLISRYTLHHLMQRYGEVVGLPVEKQKFHCLKHSIATHLLDAGADLSFVKDWLGHVNIQNTTIYRLTTATLDSTARKVFASHRVV